MTDTVLPVRGHQPTLAARLARFRDLSLGLLLRSPLRRLVGSGLLLLTYRGRRSGRIYTTPVEFVGGGDCLLVLVAHPERKQWWRNVAADPTVRVLVDGCERSATATVEIGIESAAADLARYTASRPRSARVGAASGEQLVIVRLDLAPETAPARVGR